jgi:hypothetical protein
MNPSADFKEFVASLAAAAVLTLKTVEELLEREAGAAATSGGEATESPPAGAEGEQEPLTPEQIKRRTDSGLASAQRLIDTLAMLEEKTKGNLTAEEGEYLQAALTELRMGYVRASGRTRKPT